MADVTILRDREAALEIAIRERDHALARVRTLHGLIPICAYCKRIRDEKQMWHAIESYIAANSDAQFSHGICPACSKEHFGNIVASLPDA